MLLQRYGPKPNLLHDGKIITLASDMRWCSDMFEIQCWNGEKVHVAFSLDCCDREAIGWVAGNRHLDGTDVRDLIALSVDARFKSTRTARDVEWLTDNGPPYTANDTRAFASTCGLLPRNTPAYSPESNGMAEAFVKTIKRDYVYVADLPDAETVLTLLPAWFDDYNEHQPHKHWAPAPKNISATNRTNCPPSSIDLGPTPITKLVGGLTRWPVLCSKTERFAVGRGQARTYGYEQPNEVYGDERGEVAPPELNLDALAVDLFTGRRGRACVIYEGRSVACWGADITQHQHWASQAS